MRSLLRPVLAAVLSLLAPSADAQAAPNRLAFYSPANRTMSVNNTWCIVPIDAAAVQPIKGHAPLPLPSDPTLFPQGFPAGKHPLVAFAGFENDIRMAALGVVPLQIPSLMGGALIVPFVDATGDGRTPIGVPVNYYQGGTYGRDLEAVVPSVAAIFSPFEGTDSFPATFAPSDAAVQDLGAGLYAIGAKPYLLPNTVSGPGVYAEAFDVEYQLTESSPYVARTFHALMNQPQLLNTGRCQRNTVYFNFTDARPSMAVGNVTLYHQILDTPPAAIEGVYDQVYCYEANGQLVASVGEDCKVAASRVDPASLQ